LNFFGQPAENRPAIHEEIFTLLYYAHGGFTHTEVYNMPIYLRRFYLKTLEKVIKQETESQKNANKTSDSKIHRPNIR